ncbi:hypothetical protein E1295_48075 [Nonomuraea mesophila]|uniref:Uncharacterized protein n=1 Tax=Nonomuraea mesophila TaxID=2530382 RepID=A0A4R5DWB1_9ACTN|nr:hypothetical protein [Nonomuraea mesophila]TDE18872.1 hypothetical protein E1295_48075 [Nonomuraea mesophila]
MNLLVLAAEPDWVARGFTALGIIIAGASAFLASRSMIIAKRAYERGHYEVVVDIEISATDIEIGPDTISRRTQTEIVVSNRRMGKVQVTRFHGQVAGEESFVIEVVGPALGHTLDGIQQETWWAGSSHKRPASTPHEETSRVRVGAELANKEVIWSDWASMDTDAARQVIHMPT